MMDKKTLAYIAAFLDADGYIGIHSNRPRKTNSNIYDAEMGFMNTNLPILKFLQGYLGGSIQKKKKPNERCKDRYYLQITAKPIAKVLPKLLPYLRIKREEAEIVLEFIKRKNKGFAGARLPEEERKERRRLWQGCKDAKKKR